MSMGAIIESIGLQNFYNYYGNYEENTYRFKEGINIINADNNMGKSKFYNGILWIVEDEVYDADKKGLRSVTESYELMASGKAKNEKHEFTMGVMIVFFEQNNKYTIKKEVRFVKNNGKWITTPYFEVLQTVENKDVTVHDSTEKEVIVKKLIPEELKRYALLQGESLEELVDLSSRSGLSSTIEALVGIRSLIEAYDTSKDLVKRAYKDLNNSERIANAEDKKVLEDLSKKEEFEKRVDQTKERLELYQEELTRAENIRQDLEAHLLNAHKREELRGKLSELKFQIDEKKKKKDSLEKDITKQILSEDYPWLLKGLEGQISTFRSLREDLIVKKTEKNLMETVILLPEGSPDKESLKVMLDKEHCSVCNRSALKNSEAWLHIEKVLNRPRPKVEKQRNDFDDFYSNIQNSTSAFVQNLKKTDEYKRQYRLKVFDLEEKIKNIEEARERVELEYINVGGKDGYSGRTDGKTISDFTLAGRTIEQKKGEIQEAQERIKLLKRQISSINEKLDKKPKNENVEKYRSVYNAMKQLEKLFENTKERIYDEIITSLERNANEKYEELTRGNLTSGGRLEFKKQTDETVQVSIRDVNNNAITGLGTGFQRMKQLSIVMAIISSKIGDKQFNFPFISDAPFSEFGNNFINNFFDIAPKVFTQSIILIKELYDPKTDDLLNDQGRRILEKMKNGEILGTFYVNTIQEKADTANLVTGSKCYVS